MSRKWKTIFVIIESAIMAFCYGMSAVSYFWEVYRCTILSLAVGIFMNVAIISRTKRWEDERIVEEGERKMREILFRGKRVDNGEWVEGYYVNCRYPNDQTVTGHFIVIHPGIFSEIYTNTLCQYTGLKDKNGKRIWENDILRRPYHPEDDCIVVWHDGRFNFQTIHGQYNQDPMTLLSICFVQKNVDWLNVIGNIFDNPELMKE